ncbi:MAG: aromatic amino acid hydroxylase [candidate division Zixibacteria bacterium]|nr:aromatic amino acid hydroxylase [candidate division Zixibacteria bacterium]
MSTASATLTGFDINRFPHLTRLPNHLKQFIVDQDWRHYTPIDHAVWRYIMRQAIRILKENAHGVYFEGLLNTGISLDAIPRIEDMNDILGRIGWGCVAVDGFIPPAAFMEYQAYRVLVIACDMRQIHHIEYTPAPDIVHEAAGHAPIIVDREYADYLQKFGEIGAKAMSSRKDFELYEAIRRLSILKEAPDTDQQEIESTEKLVLERQANLGAPSEMSRLSRLHWWTVEYGLIGDMENPKIYGAGLLSSIGEAVSCLGPEVKKLPYSLDAADYAFDITTKQPQLFVTRDFDQLMSVLEQFSETMAYRRGGSYGIEKAIECNNTATAEYSSGLQVSGIFSGMIPNGSEQPAYIQAKGPSALAYNYKELHGHDKKYHADGFGSPVGKLRGIAKPLENHSDSDLTELGITIGSPSKLAFESGVTVTGKLERIERRGGKIILMVFSNCSVTHGGQTLYKPEWGPYDMAVGERIVSVFNGAADKDAFDQIALVSKTRTIRTNHSERDYRLQAIYAHIRDIRDNKNGYEGLPSIRRNLTRDFPEDWLASLEILEILLEKKLSPDICAEIRSSLEQTARSHPELTKVITDGLALVG